MSVAVHAASIIVFLFIQRTYSEANIVESLASFFHSQSLSSLPISLSSCNPPLHKKKHILTLFVMFNPAASFSRWFSLRDETILVGSYSRLHGFMRWSVFVYKHFFGKKKKMVDAVLNMLMDKLLQCLSVNEKALTAFSVWLRASEERAGEIHSLFL